MHPGHIARRDYGERYVKYRCYEGMVVASSSLVEHTG